MAPSNYRTTFNCTTCLKNKLGNAIFFNNDAWCSECLKQPTDLMIQSEDRFSPQINGITIKPTALDRSLFTSTEARENYLRLLQMKIDEYSTPTTLRLYCNCPGGMYVGALIRYPAPNETTIQGCGVCMSEYCMVCAEKVDGASAGALRKHLGKQCVPKAKTRALEKERELEGQTRGVDYQDCPECEVHVQLVEGCNHVTCQKCKAHFCYVCGCPAQGNSDHWRPGESASHGEKCIFSGKDTSGAAKGAEKRAALS